MQSKKYDVLIVGAGVIGCAIARELSRYEISIAVLEKEEDVCSGTSKANSGIVHAGFDAMPGTLKAKLNVEGNRRMEELSRTLDFEFVRNGSLVACFQEDEKEKLNKLYQRGLENGVQSLQLLGRDEVLKMEPNVSEQVVAALFAPTGGIVCPFGLTIALAENACTNGCEFHFHQTVEKVSREEGGYHVMTKEGNQYHTTYLINAAGVYADQIHNQVSKKKIQIQARRGEYCLLDKEAGMLVTHTIFQLPSKYGKGVLVTPTVHKNLLVGPNARDVAWKEDTRTTKEGLEEVLLKSTKSVPSLDFRQIITSFSGLRAHTESNDFLIGEIFDAPNCFDVAGIESPGLSCAPAIGEYVTKMIVDKRKPKKKEHFCERRKGQIRANQLTCEERTQLILKRPEYGQIICRCEEISEGEIVDAIHRRPGAVSMDGVKRRVRQGMGRCQGGFCTQKCMEILARETNRSMEEICKNRQGSELLRSESVGER